MSDEKHSHLEQSGASDESIQQVHAREQSSTAWHGSFSLTLIGVMCIAIYLGAIYLVNYSGHFDPSIYNEHQKPSLQAAAGPTLTPAMFGKRVFTANCMACHQATGQGVPGVYPPLAGSEFVLKPEHEKHIIKIVLFGLNGPITVKGANFNNAMTPFGSLLKDEQIAQVLTYVRSEWGNNAPEIKPEQVAAIRAELGARGPWTVEELLKTP
ncbi:MAG: cytochrome c [Candidatus Didemnitutus sp.]|nr:cytochrome c [Candidatus Didemnitutus sp.]